MSKGQDADIMRIIDNVLVTETGCERLSKTTRDLIVV